MINVFSGKPAAFYDETNPDCGPTILFGYEIPQVTVDRHHRLTDRKKKDMHDAAMTLLNLSTTVHETDEQDIECICEANNC